MTEGNIMPEARDPLREAQAKVKRLTEAYLEAESEAYQDRNLLGRLPFIMPLIPFVAKDALSVEVLEFYLRRLRETRDQRKDPRTADPIITQAGALLATFYIWQGRHPDEVKLPD